MGLMAQFSTGFSRDLRPNFATAELATEVESVLGGAGDVGGGLLFATSASGNLAFEVGERLGNRWPDSGLTGSSFEGLLAKGQVFRDEPAFGLLAWAKGDVEPIPLFFDPAEVVAEQLAFDLFEAAGRSIFTEDDLLLLFPDALASVGLEPLLADLLPRLGTPSVAGAATSGSAGGACLAWSGAEHHPAATIGLLVPGGLERGSPRVRCAGASRFASPWLEISSCRERWIDGLDGEPPLDWIRRQLGLDEGAAIEPHLDRLLVRLRDPGTRGDAGKLSAGLEAGEEETAEFEERYVIGLDDRRGSISVPGAFRRGGHLALALPDAEKARESLRTAVGALTPSSHLMQFACRARDETLHGDTDLESALVAHAAPDRTALGTVGPFQLGPASAAQGSFRRLVHSTVLAAIGNG